MITCQFSEIKKDISKHIRERRIIPIIGSGFTVNSPACNGIVPSGTDMKKYMVEAILDQTDLDDKSINLSNKSFPQIATYYHRLINREIQKKYIRDNFTRVELTEERVRLLEIDWLYIYTLNIDDAIEKNSQYNKVICSNRRVDFSVLTKDKCVIKLHGDASTYLCYEDDNSQILGYKEYAKSIESNQNLLNKLRHDYAHNNLIFIGCGLDDEFDLATIDMYNGQETNEITAKYYFTICEPDEFKTIELQEYGITHVVLNDSYEQLYDNLHEAYIESQQIQIEDIDIYRNLGIRRLPLGFENNKDYLFYGKNIIDTKAREIVLPAFFTDREVGSIIIENLVRNKIQVVCGPRVSGKTYLLASIACRVRDRDVYFFDSRYSINLNSLEFILNKENTLAIFDTNSINKDMIFNLIQQHGRVNIKNNNIIIAINNSDKDIVSTINKNVYRNEIIGHYLYPKFSTAEINNINALMPLNELPNFDLKKTILDNLIEIERVFVRNGRFSRIKPNLKTVDDVVILILLAVNEKIYTTDLINFDIESSCFAQVQKTTPLISEEHTLVFERDIQNSSDKKIVINAKYWLIECLGNYAENKNNHSLIVEAYREIVSAILAQSKRYSYSTAMDYFKFDVINEIFQSDIKGRLGLAKQIYEGLHVLLSDNPHYYHQRAKCLLWQSSYSLDDLPNLGDALRYANIANHNFDILCKQKNNEKLLYSLAHTKFTIALILSRICVINELSENERKEAISAIYEAIQFDDNKKDFLEIKQNRTNKKDDINSVIDYSLTHRFNDKSLEKELNFIANQLLKMS